MSDVPELDLLDCSLDRRTLIEASAGTGKTWSLCTIYLRLLIEQPLAVDRILVVTFTTAATAELRTRIRARIDATLDLLRTGTSPRDDGRIAAALLARAVAAEGRDAIVHRLETALRSFDEAAIHTIHGFCQRALAEAPFVAGMPLAMTLAADDGELPREVAQDFWRREVAGRPISAALAASLERERDRPERFGQLLQRQLAKPLAKLVWPEETARAGPTDHRELATRFEVARNHWLARRDTIIAALRAAPLHKSHYTPQSLQLGAVAWDVLFGGDDPFAAVADKADLYRTSRIRSTKAAAILVLDPFHDACQAWLELRAGFEATGDLERLRLIARLLADGTTEVRRRRRDGRVVAFDDMLFNLHQRLLGPGGEQLAAALRARYPAALVDEFQDTDPLQNEVLEAIYPEASSPLFLLGDPKQAIYGFRNADLHSYLRAKRRAASVQALISNQRASAALVGALNALFGGHPRAFLLDGIDYRPAHVGARVRPAFEDATDPTNPAALRIWLLPSDGAGKPIARAHAQQGAVSATAGEIARLLRAGLAGRILIGGEPLRARDVAVLVRTHAEGDAVKQALGRLRIGSVELSQASVFASIDAEEIETALRAVLDPSYSAALHAALATELVGWDVARIAALEHDDAGQLAVFSRFADYRDAWRVRGVGAMYRRLLADEDVAARMLARDDGERRLTNLLHLGECLQQASRRHPEPEALLRWLHEQRREPPRDESQQLRLESDQNLVQIVTIHKAKGLEYPVVFCPFLWGAPWQRPPSKLDGREYHDEAGNTVIDFGPETPAVKERIRAESAAEDVRLIYVALTRAVHRCYLVAGAVNRIPRGLLNGLVAPDAEPAAVADAWARLAAQTPELAVQPLPDAVATPLARDDPDPKTLAALSPPRIASGWRIGSYTSLTSQMEWAARAVPLLSPARGAAADHDARSRDLPPSSVMPLDLDPDDILRFPRGAHAGETLHALLERVDFGDPVSWPGAIDAAFDLLPLGAPLRAMALRLLGDLAAAPLAALDGGEALRLRDVARSARLAELEFVLPAPRLTERALAQTLDALGYPTPRLGFAPLAGYLSGFIDLVFAHRDRFYLVDWKSNHLGFRTADYGRVPVQAAMVEHAYPLQYLLYTVALDRYLRRRIAGYEYRRHFGGVLYLFVRGVRPGWHDEEGAPSGVFFERPAPEAIARLDRLLAGDSAS